jgi:non-heme chloroperoxidase
MASIVTAIYAGEQKYTSQIHVPILAIYALPHDLASDHPNDPKGQAVDEKLDFDKNSLQAEAFERAQPAAHVIRLPHASHWVFLTNEAEVIRDINGFISSLPQ